MYDAFWNVCASVLHPIAIFVVFSNIAASLKALQARRTGGEAGFPVLTGVPQICSLVAAILSSWSDYWMPILLAAVDPSWWRLMLRIYRAVRWVLSRKKPQPDAVGNGKEE